jgi:tRNA pseudouridine55 synthase
MSGTHAHRPAQPPGLVIVDKPAGMTSHDVVGAVRRMLGTRKVGHAGTLDPMATGVLVLGVERATKLLGHLALDVKSYHATIVLGLATSTDDAEGDSLGTTDASGVAEHDIRSEMAGLTGALAQRPSSVSAVKVAGRRAYELAREGKAVELAARRVHVERFDLLALRRAGTRVEADATVRCSSGTYVRALARDLGAALGVGGHVSVLRRIEVGPFDLGSAVTLDELEAQPGLTLDLAAAVRAAFPERRVDDAEMRAIGHGRRITAAGRPGVSGAFDASGRPIALLQESGDSARSVLLLELSIAG